MKCHSAECLWSATPPPHRITETAVLNQPPTLYTGGSDGSIIWWKLGSPSNQDVWPMAMLCGHAASIAGLDICVPRVDHGEIESIDIKTTSVGSEALMSACTDGVLCIWTSRSGYCRRRRKLPPWVGSPTAMLSLPVSRRYVCVACSYVDAVSVPNYSTAGIPEARNVDHFQNETVTEREIASRRTSKGAVVIVDSCTLNIVRTVFHGSFSIGPVKSMALVVSLEGRKDQSVILADALGRVQLFAILKKCDPEGDGGSGPVKSSPCNGETSNWAEILHDGIQGISVAPHGRLLVFIFRSHCTFKTSSGVTVGEISLLNSSLLKESSQAYLIGGMFLEIENATDALDVQDTTKGSIENFVMWSNTGAALIISISRSLDSFNFEPLCEIPSVSHAPNVKICISFCQLSSYLLRIESICSEVEHPLLWKPRISIWSISHPPVLQSDIQNKLVKQSDARENSNDHVDPHFSIMLGESGFLGDWTWSSNCFPKSEGGLRHTACPKSKKEDTGKNSRQSCFPATNLNDYCGERGDDLVLKERVVSSSMVLSEDSYAPYAVAYGFCSGEIIVVKLEMFVQENVVDASLNHGIDLHASDIIFSGHTGAILCLAAHRMVATLGQQKFKHVLLSGSMDCTVRIWDLGSGELVSVMHHHLAPVRQIILPPLWTDHPWDDCFLSVGEDACVALASLETLRVERMFPGHPSYPRMVVWDSARGYIACLCRKLSSLNDEVDVLYLWDVKTGARERVIRGAASHSMFDHFCKGINVNVITGNILGGTTSASSLFLHAFEDASFSHDAKNLENINVLYTGGKSQRRIAEFTELNGSLAPNSKEKLRMSKSAHDLTHQVPLDPVLQSKKHPIKCSCPFPGVATLRFDLSSLMAPISGDTLLRQNDDKEQDKLNVAHKSSNKSTPDVKETLINIIEQPTWVLTLDGCLLRFGLSFLHIWGIDHELDRLLVDEMGICRPEKFLVSAGHVGDRGSLTLMFPGLRAALELWRSSSEFCAMRSLTMVSLAQRMIGLSHSTSAASSALAAFYTRNFAERVPDIQPPLLQLLVSFWKDPSEHVRMAARSLFHCAASRAIPLPICSQKTTRHAIDSSIVNCEGTDVNSDTGESSPNSLLNLDGVTEKQENHQAEESEILTWLESYDVQDWICCIGGTNQDAKASHIVVAGALAVWYPSLVKPTLATSVAHHLVKLVMALTDKYSATAAELLAEGMESTWKACIGPEIPHMVGDIFLLIECLSSTSANTTVHNTVMAVTIRDILVGALLPSLAMGDITGFLSIVESQIWATASDSPVHVVSLMTLIRVVRSSPKPLAPHLDKVVNFILQTMDHGNSVMRKACLNSSLTALREAARVFPMVALNEASTRLAVGDAIGDIHNLSIQVYDIQSVTKIKVLDASGPPGLPSFLAGELDGTITTAISALSFSPDGEGLVAFSEHGLMIRWWSLGSAWWEKLSSRSIVPVQCTKLILVPPWEGFSPNTSRSSIMASIIGNGSQTNTQERTRGLADADRLKLLIHNLDLSYRLEWVAGRKLVLKRQGQELGSFQL